MTQRGDGGAAGAKNRAAAKALLQPGAGRCNVPGGAPPWESTVPAQENRADLFGLNEVDEVPAGVLEDYDLDGPHVLGLAAELDSPGLEALDLGGDVLRDEGGGGDARFEQSLLVVAGRRKSQRLQNELDALDAVGRGHREPAILPHRDIRHLLEAEDGRVEPQSALLIFNRDADELDLHGYLVGCRVISTSADASRVEPWNDSAGTPPQLPSVIRLRKVQAAARPRRTARTPRPSGETAGTAGREVSDRQLPASPAVR